MLNLTLELMGKVKLGWSELTIPEKMVKASSVVATMSSNSAVYVTPDPPLADIDAAVSALGAAQAEAIKGGTDRTITRNARLNELTDLMNTLVSYVELISDGDPEKIAQAGMDVRKQWAPKPEPEQVQNLNAQPGGNPGTILLTWDASRYKKSYVVEIFMEGDTNPPEDPLDPDAPSSEGAWEVLTVQGKREYQVLGLVTGKSYRFRVAAQNAAGMGTYSNEAQSVAR